MAEQRDGEGPERSEDVPPEAERPAAPPGDGGHEPSRPPAAGTPPQPPVDPEELRRFREFREFQQFQEYLRFTGAQRGPGEQGGEIVPSGGAYPATPPSTEVDRSQAGTVATRPDAELQRPGFKPPKWFAWLGKKVLGWIIAFVMLAIAATWLYHHFFPGSKDDDRPAAETGGGTYHTNLVFSTQPYLAVQYIYKNVAEGPPVGTADACDRMDAPTQAKFARDFDAPDCVTAVSALHAKVTDINAYATSIPPNLSDTPDVSRLDVSSCAFGISGGPGLGTFTVQKVDKGQWLIVGHQPDPTPCPPLPGATATTTSSPPTSLTVPTGPLNPTEPTGLTVPTTPITGH